MATNGYKDVVATRTSSGNVGDTLRFEWRQTAQSISGNYTDINWKMSLIAGGAGKISSSASKSWSVTVDGQNFSGSNTVGIGNNATKVLASGTKRVYHDNDGTKRLYVSFSQVFNINFNGHVGTVSGSANWDLNTIPRASAFNVSGDTIGSPITITVDTHSSDFRHTLWYHLPGQGWQEVAYGIVTQHSFTISVSECSFLPNSVSGNLELRLRTLNGGTQIGSDVYKTVTVYVPTSVVPTVDSVTVTEAVAGIKEQFGAYVQDRSKLSVKSVGSGIYGSTVKKYTVQVDGKSYEGADITTEAIESSGQVSISVTVMDSRGRKASKTVNITVAEYHRPFIRNFDAIRSDKNGVQQNSGTCLKCICDFEISAVGNKNTKRYVIEYRKKSDEMWTQAFAGSVYSLTDSFIQQDVLGVEFPYVVRLTVTDYFESITFEDVIGSAIVPWCVHPSGKGFGVGGYPEGEFFQVFMRMLYKNDPIAYYPVGSIYMSVNPTSPAELFGGSWEQIKGRFLLGADETYLVNSEGGEAEHTLTVDEMPSHQHASEEYKTHAEGAVYGHSTKGSSTAGGGSGNFTYKYLRDTKTSIVGGSQPHNNMPPYLAVYIWKRTA